MQTNGEQDKNNGDPERDEQSEANDDEDKLVENVNRVQRGPGRSKLICTGKPGRPRKAYNKLNAIGVANIQVPSGVKEALSMEHAEEWKAAMQKEYSQLQSRKTWSLVDLPAGERTIGSKWVFAIKGDQYGYVERFKARLVAKDCRQEYGVNYTETFSPVARYSSIRLVIALAVEYKMFMHQMDVSAAYLNSDLQDVGYMRQPEGFVDTAYPKRVLRLHKSLYGLKQSGREWNQKLDSTLQHIGFIQCPSEPCIYTKKIGGNLSIIVVYVDDLIISCSRKEDLVNIKLQITQEFDVVDGGELNHFLGMEIERNGETGSVTIGSISTGCYENMAWKTVSRMPHL